MGTRRRPLCAAIGCAAVFFRVMGDDFGKDTPSNVMNQAYLLVGIVSFVIGVAMAMVVLTIIDTSVATIFVCFAEDKEALARNHPQHHNDMMSEWLEFHADEMYACGYAHQ